MELRVGGRRLYAATGGKEFDPALPAVVFLHGAGMDPSVWAMQTRWFAHHGRSVLAFDLPGHGRSGGPGLGSIAEMASLVASALETAGAREASVVGHSMGALIALEVAASASGLITAAALCGAAPAMPVHPDLLAAASRGEHGAIDLMTTWALGRDAQIGGNVAPGLWMTGGAMRLLERADAPVLAADLAACNAYKGAEAAAAKVACPVLLLLGADDRMTPAAKGAAFARAFKSATAVTLPKTGHMMMVEEPAATLNALAAFLSPN